MIVWVQVTAYHENTKHKEVSTERTILSEVARGSVSFFRVFRVSVFQ
jgi:hypothetical protein